MQHINYKMVIVALKSNLDTQGGYSIATLRDRTMVVLNIQHYITSYNIEYKQIQAHLNTQNINSS